ncbi:MAG TPA: hypothetical protein VF399_02995 [bacterium]
MRLSLFFITLLILGSGLSQPVYRQTDGILIAPRILNYQGFMTDTLGNQFTGEATVKASICDSIVVGRTLWTEVITNVPIDHGTFNVVLGNVTPIPDSVFNQALNRWLEVSVNSYTFAPRTQITATAGAFEALWSKTADYALAGPPDLDWVVGTGNLDSTLLTGNRLGISRGGVGNVLYDTYRHTHLNLGTACTTGVNGENNTYITVAGGYRNSADSNGATVAGGTRNHAGQYFTFIGGGYENAVHGYFGVAAGGKNNTVFSDYGGILSGTGNVTGEFHSAGYRDTCAVVLGGVNNNAMSAYTFVGNGNGNSIEWLSTILNGRNNTYNSRFLKAVAINGESNFFGGWNEYCLMNGRFNGIISDYNCIAGGLYDTVGYYNMGGSFSFNSLIVGGDHNWIMGNYNFIGNGKNNDVRVGFDYDSDYNAIGGGSDNLADQDPYTAIAGGMDNAVNEHGNVIGGNGNDAYNISSVGGGYGNHCYLASSVVGGYQNTARYYSFAANNQSTAGLNYADSINNVAAFNGQTVPVDGATGVGIIAKGSGAFSIDHPLDPEHKILNHYFAESPEMVLMYRGVAKIGVNGQVEVRLPDYFAKLNKNPAVKLTGVGTSDVHLKEKIKENRFVISGSAGVEVHWLVTGDRRDPSAEIVRILKPVEQEKGKALAGRSMDDNFLLSSLPQLERMGKAGAFNFRNPVNKKKYEDMKHSLEEAKTGESSAVEGRQP